MSFSSPQRHPVPPPPAHAWILLVALAGVLPLAGVGLAAWLEPGARSGFAKAWPVLALVPVLLAWLAWAMRRRLVELRGRVLDVRAAMYRRQVPVEELDLDRARIVDLAERTELRPWLKTNGMWLPGFHAGRFRLRGGRAQAFCLLTDQRRVLWLPLRDGKQQLLLSLAQPQALLDALRNAR